MIKKLTLLAMAVAAIAAFAVPASASASPAVTNSEGNLLAEGTSILGVSNNAVTITSLGNLECETVELTGKITENTGSTFAGNASGSTGSGKCFLVKGETKKEIKITNITLNSLMSEAGGNTNVNFSFEADLPTVTCKFATAAAGVTATYVNLGHVLKLTSQPLASAACGKAEISGEFTVTSGGSNVVLDT